MRTDIERFRDMCKIAHIGWWESDINTGKYIYSDSIKETLGFSTNFLSFNEFMEYIRDDYKELLQSELYEFSGRPNDFYHQEFPMVTPNGEFWVRITMGYHYNEDNMKGGFGTLQQIQPNEVERKDLKKNNFVNHFISHQWEVSNALNDFLSDKGENIILQNILNTVRDYFGISSVTMFEFCDDGHSQECIYESTDKKERSILITSKKIQCRHIPWISGQLKAEHPVVVSNIQNMPREAYKEKSLFRRAGIKSFMAIPLTSHGKVWGNIGISSLNSTRNWNNADYKWLLSISNIVNICLELSRSKQVNTRNESLFKDIFTNIPIGEAIYDKNGRLTDMNNSFKSIFGLTSFKDANGFSFLLDRNLTPETKKLILENDLSAFNINYSFDKVDNYITYRKGVVNLYCKLIKLYDSDSKFFGFLFICIEDSDRLIAMSRVRNFESIFSLIADYAKVGYVHYDLISKKGSAINQWYKNMGESDNKDLGDVIGNYRHMHPDDKEQLRNFFEAVKRGEAKNFEGEIRIRKEGTTDEWKWIYKNLLVTKFEPENSTIELVGVNYDISEFKSIEKELIEARNKAENSDRLKSAFLANMSHEVRTPLNAIVGFSDLIAETDNREERQQYMAIIRENTEILLQLINDILDLSKIEAGTVEVSYGDVDIDNLCKDLVRSMQFKVKNGVQLHFSTPHSGLHIWSDRNRIYQVISNFVNNAIKFTSQGSIDIGYDLIKEDTEIRFSVTDTGIGIDEEGQKKIFGRFVKLNSFVQGTGLGLSICQSIIEQMNGRIGVNSELGKGSCFWFILPVNKKLIQNEKLSNEGKSVAHSDSDGNSLNAKTESDPLILIAEDNESNFLLVSSILRKKYRIIRAHDGVEACECCKNMAPDLVLMDIRMPRMNGFEATRKIRINNANVPIIALTAFAFAKDKEEAFRVGCTDYMTKPVNSKVLKEIVGKYLS